jgi:hypothetical protein
MTFFDYKQSRHIEAQDYTFYSLIMAAIRKADTDNLAKLEKEWPEVVEEFKRRYNAPGGIIESDET